MQIPSPNSAILFTWFLIQNILLNLDKHLKKFVPYYILPFFIFIIRLKLKLQILILYMILPDLNKKALKMIGIKRIYWRQSNKITYQIAYQIN